MSKEPKYEVLQSYEKIELRLYEPFLVAEVECPGIRKEAIRSGFRILANYIFGNNIASAKLRMSIPVTQQKIGDGCENSIHVDTNLRFKRPSSTQ